MPLPSSRTLFTLLTAFSPYSSARCLAFFTDLPRNFFNWVLVGNKQQQISYIYGRSCAQGEGNQFPSTHYRRPLILYVFCFSFPPSVSVRGAWGFSSSSDCAASFLWGEIYNKSTSLRKCTICFYMMRLKKDFHSGKMFYSCTTPPKTRSLSCFFLEAWFEG